MPESPTFFTAASSPQTPVATGQMLDDNFTLNQFLDDGQQKLLNLMDDFRSSSDNEYFEPLQIIICGGQSCGKSSVLEGISGQNFPRGEGLCTTFAIELVLRRKEPSVAVNVIPAESNAGAKELETTYDTFRNLEKLVSTVKSNFQQVHTLRVEVSNPNWPPLTLVDLPPLIQSANEKLSKEDVDSVKHRARNYTRQKKKRTIILAILSAENYTANQEVLGFVKEEDPQGERTMGIITKPDKLERGSKLEREFLQYAANNDFKLGWYVVRNRGHGEENYTLEERNRKEDEFFADSIWKREFGSKQLGINSVRIQLSKLLREHIRTAIPMVIDDINNCLRNCKEEIQVLGEHRPTLIEKETYLLEISSRFQELVSKAVSNNCDKDRFFNEDSKHTAERNLRSFIEQSNKHFRDIMYNRGHKLAVLSDTSRYLAWPFKTGRETHGFHSIGAPKSILRDEYIRIVEREIAKHKSRQIPHTFDPRIVNRLFREQSSRWRGIACAHIEYVFTATAYLLHDAVTDACKKNENTTKLLSEHIINNILERRRDVLELKLNEILMPYEKLQAATLNPYFNRSSGSYMWGIIDKLRKEIDQYDKNLKVSGSESSVIADLRNIISNAERTTEFASTASEVLDLVHDYYEVALMNFVENVVNLVIENSLIHDLETEFTPFTVRKMARENKDLLALLSSELPNDSQRRVELTQKVEELSKALKICLDARGPGAIPNFPKDASNYYHQLRPFIEATNHQRADDPSHMPETTVNDSVNSRASSSHSVSSSLSNCTTRYTSPSLGSESGDRFDFPKGKMHQKLSSVSSESPLDAGNTEAANRSSYLLSSTAGNFDSAQSFTPTRKGRGTTQPRSKLRHDKARESGLCSPAQVPVQPSEKSEEEI